MVGTGRPHQSFVKKIPQQYSFKSQNMSSNDLLIIKPISLTIFFIITRNFGENKIEVRGFDESTFLLTGYDAKCTSNARDEMKCCKKVLNSNPPTKKCEDDPDYHCVPVQVIKKIRFFC